MQRRSVIRFVGAGFVATVALTTYSLAQSAEDPVTVPAVADAGAAPDGRANQITLYNNGSCDCCNDYADYLKANGFDVTLIEDQQYYQVALAVGMPVQGISCHVTKMEGYTMSGFIPVMFIDKLVNERPDISGITLPGMRMEAPGMDEDEQKTLQVYSYAPAGVSLYPMECGQGID